MEGMGWRVGETLCAVVVRPDVTSNKQAEGAESKRASGGGERCKQQETKGVPLVVMKWGGLETGSVPSGLGELGLVVGKWKRTRMPVKGPLMTERGGDMGERNGARGDAGASGERAFSG